MAAMEGGSMKNLSDLVTKVFSAKEKVYERELSTRELSVREMRRGGYAHRIRHRFPIKGGMSLSEIMKENITAKNALYERLKK